MEQCPGIGRPTKELIMPSEVVNPMLTTSASRRAGLMLRARVWIKSLELDAALADGADPAQSEELALRAEQLATRKKRDELASGVNRLIAITDRQHRATAPPPHPFSGSREVQDYHSLLLDLELRLRAYRPVAPRGIALISLMLDDGHGPLSAESSPATLERAVRAALSALDDGTDARGDAQPGIGARAEQTVA
jgi:hypothetical protein